MGSRLYLGDLFWRRLGVGARKEMPMPHALRVLWALLRQPTPRAAQPMKFRLQLWALTALVLLLASLGGGAPSDGDGGALSNGGGGEGVTATAAPWMAPAAQRVACDVSRSTPPSPVG